MFFGKANNKDPNAKDNKTVVATEGIVKSQLGDKVVTQETTTTTTTTTTAASAVNGSSQEEVRRKFNFSANKEQGGQAGTPVAFNKAIPRIQISPIERGEQYYKIKSEIYNELISLIDLQKLNSMSADISQPQIESIVKDIINNQKTALSLKEQESLIKDIINDILGYGNLQDLLARDDISDIMINGANHTYIEIGGKLLLTDLRFESNEQLLLICQKIVRQVGRRVDEASPICDARLLDGSRVNVIIPPLAIDGPTLTIRKFKKDRLKMRDLVRFGSLDDFTSKIIQIASYSRCNILVSGGTGSGKTTLLNCLTEFIDVGERIVTCEDSAELQLKQPHVVRLETRPSLDEKQEINMRDLVRNCLRMRPDRIIVGEVRGFESFDLLQAMNTGHDGSMGTLHANNPREAISRLESMISMGSTKLNSRTIREMIVSSVDVIIQTQRLRDGQRKITYMTEIVGLEGDTPVLQDIFTYRQLGENSEGKIMGKFLSGKVTRPIFYQKARAYGLEKELTLNLEALISNDDK